jgi:hypothetical protein
MALIACIPHRIYRKAAVEVHQTDMQRQYAIISSWREGRYVWQCIVKVIPMDDGVVHVVRL